MIRRFRVILGNASSYSFSFFAHFFNFWCQKFAHFACFAPFFNYWPLILLVILLLFWPFGKRDFFLIIFFKIILFLCSISLMPLYRCQHCNYTTSRKSNHIRHLKTHKRLISQDTNRSDKNYLPKNSKISPIFTRNLAKNGVFLDSEPCKITQNYPKLPEITRFLNSDNFENRDYCIFCQKRIYLNLSC